MARHDGEIHGTALRNLGDGAHSAAFGQASQQLEAGWIAQGLEQVGVKRLVKRTFSFAGLLWRCRAMFGYLRHNASINSS